MTHVVEVRPSLTQRPVKPWAAPAAVHPPRRPGTSAQVRRLLRRARLAYGAAGVRIGREQVGGGDGCP